MPVPVERTDPQKVDSGTRKRLRGRMAKRAAAREARRQALRDRNTAKPAERAGVARIRETKKQLKHARQRTSGLEAPSIKRIAKPKMAFRMTKRVKRKPSTSPSRPPRPGERGPAL